MASCCRDADRVVKAIGDLALAERGLANKTLLTTQKKAAWRFASRRTPRPGGAFTRRGLGKRDSVLECAGRANSVDGAFPTPQTAVRAVTSNKTRPTTQKKAAWRFASRRTPRPGGAFHAPGIWESATASGSAPAEPAERRPVNAIEQAPPRVVS